MQQYFEMKSKHPDAILLFRVGDFYETFGEDAIKASGILGIVLTARNNGGSKIELAGFPYHSIDVYLPKLVKAGLRVAICEQLEKPSKEKKIVKRGVTDIVTPGLGVSDSLLNQKSNNYLAAVSYGDHKNPSAIALLELSTGEFLCTEGSADQIDKLLYSFEPSEVLFSKSEKSKFDHIKEDFYLYGLEEWIFGIDFSNEKLVEHFKTNSLKGFGIDKLKKAQITAGAIIYYLQLTENKSLDHINKISRIENDNFVWLDQFTMRNLELVNSLHPSGVSLLDVLDHTKTPMGARLLRKWILLPLTQIIEIRKRQNMVAALKANPNIVEELDELFVQIGDMERLVGKVAMSRCNPKELFQLKKSLLLIPFVNGIIMEIDNDEFSPLNTLDTTLAILSERLSNDPPFLIAKGQVIQSGFNKDLDELRGIIKNSKDILNNVLLKETQTTGIQNLKIGFNNVFGYYFEVTNRYKDHDLIPDSWTRKQTLTNAERYISEELKILESKILGAEEKIFSLETELYEKLLNDLIPHIHEIKNVASRLAQLDTLASLSKVATRNKYNAPKITDGYNIKIKQGRHPVIEQHLKLEEDYIPNDLFLDNENQQIIMITGPNMSGKSAILRQTALICILTQLGSFVPAEEAEIGLVDKIFTRVGASDNISSGESTFMVEMNETSNILNNLSRRSLLLLDEIGRGTSTYDGISIAWSVAEYLHDVTEAKPKTLFATHYHELNQLAEKHERIKNYNVATKEIDNKIIFLRKLMPGGSNQSFGIHVARMSGMPKEVLNRAQQILSHLQTKSIDDEYDMNKKMMNVPKNDTHQMMIFDLVDEHVMQALNELKNIDINTLTPIECMLELKKLRDMANNN